jgi:BMFP domain-containing protein YqiC
MKWGNSKRGAAKNRGVHEGGRHNTQEMILWGKKGVCPMIKNLNEQKAKLKERIDKEIDGYFAILESSSTREDFDINRIEQLMLENQRRVKTALNESNSELASNVETRVKKTAQDAERS